MHTDGVDALDLKAGALERVNHETQRSRGIRAREDVLVHEQAPFQVLILPEFSETGDLQEKHSVVVQHVVDLAEERCQVADADVFCHLEACDAFETSLWHDDVAVVHAHDVALLLGDAGFPEPVVAPRGLVAAESDARDLRAVVDARVLGEGAPAAADVEHPVAGLDVDLLADDGQLVVLQLLQGLLAVDVGDDARRVDHARAQEPAVEVVAAVVVVSHLLLVLRAGVQQHLGNEAREEMLEQTHRKPEVGPVVPVLQHLERVALEVDLLVEVHLGEGLHGDAVPAIVLVAILLAAEG